MRGGSPANPIGVFIMAMIEGGKAQRVSLGKWWTARSSCRGVAVTLPSRCRGVAVALPATAKKSGDRTGTTMVAEGSEKIEEMDK